MKYLKKIIWEYRVFERRDVFLTKYGHESNVFFSKLKFFWQNMGTRKVIFSWKIDKKGHPIDFLAHIILQFWQNWRFLSNIGITAGVFHENFEKNDMKTLCFWENGPFFTKYGLESSVFFREWTLLTKYEHESSNFIVKFLIGLSFCFYVLGF